MKAGDATVAAVFAVNALGSIFNHQTGEMLEGIRDDNGEFINPFASPENALPGTNTTIGVIATDAVLDKLQAQRLAMLAHDGLAMAIRPVHTMYDGDTAFSLATCKKKADVDQIFSLAAEVTARAICNAVLYGRG
jgi:L-aminopeptidase/D-esterase-like protein